MSPCTCGADEATIRLEAHKTSRRRLALSVAFTKEESAETAAETLLPDRPISSHPNLVTAAGLKDLQHRLAEARAEGRPKSRGKKKAATMPAAQ